MTSGTSTEVPLRCKECGNRDLYLYQEAWDCAYEVEYECTGCEEVTKHRRLFDFDTVADHIKDYWTALGSVLGSTAVVVLLSIFTIFDWFSTVERLLIVMALVAGRGLYVMRSIRIGAR